MRRILPVVGGLIIVSILFQSLNSNFLTAQNLVNLLIQAAVFALLGMGEVFVLLLGEIDLSVGYVAGMMRQDTRPSASTVVATVAVSSFVGTSVYALTGVVLGDGAAGGGDLVRVIVVALLWDVLLTPLVLPGVMRLLTRLEPAGAR